MSPGVRSRIVTDRDARLDAIRREIDALDAELLDLLNRRGRAVLEVASVKSREAEPRYYRPEREAALLRRLAAMNEGPLPDVEVMRLFREIVSTCRTLEQRLVIGCTTVGEACAAAGHFGGRRRGPCGAGCPESGRRCRRFSLRLRGDRILPGRRRVPGRRGPSSVGGLRCAASGTRETGGDTW